MSIDRRDFIRGVGLAGAGVALGATPGSVSAQGSEVVGGSPEAKPAGVTRPEQISPKRILILGGTGFIGPYMVRYAVERGHEVTIFTRGRTEADIPRVEHLIGDRNDDLSALEGGSWDVVLDNNSRDYRWTQASAELLKDSAECYLFVSSVSAYTGEASGYEVAHRILREPVADESSPLFTRPNDFVEGQDAPYGLTKALGEEAAWEAFPGRCTLVRPGLIVGPGDRTDRFTYWPVRIERGGEVLAPGGGQDATQIIDARDLSEWIIRLVEGETTGAFNAAGPESRLSIAEMLYGIRSVTSVPVQFTWVPVDFLEEQEVSPWSDMPTWIPGDPFSFVSVEKACAAGLIYRPLAVTTRDTLEFHRTLPADRPFRAISPEREREVLEAWHRREG